MFPEETQKVIGALRLIANNPYYGFNSDLGVVKSSGYPNWAWATKELLIKVDEEDLQSLKQNHHDQSHKIKGNIAFWERSRNALKECEQEEAEKSKEDEGGEEGAHQNNVDRLKASLEDLRIETHLPHHDDKDDPMEGLADLYCY